jgi:hypothetical protein
LTDLTREQADRIGARIREAMRYVGDLRERMDACGWDPNDRLYEQAMTAYSTLHGLNVTSRYLGCGMTPWRRRKPSSGYIVPDVHPLAARVV